MKKNFLIMMIMVLCAGFTFAQNHNTVRGFVPGAAGNQTYAVFGQMFGDIDLGANPYQAAEGLAQAQIVGDTLETVVGCGDSLSIGEFILTVADVQEIVDEFAADPTRPRDTFLTIQHPNAAIYNYDQLLVLHLFVCPCTVDDADGNTYDVIAIDNTHCWTKSNMRTTTNCDGAAVETMSYTSEIVSSLNVDTFGLLYKWNQAMTGSDCDSIYKTGICPCGWHLPTAAETVLILAKNTDDLRSAEGDYWVVAENITNLTKFSAQPSGYYKGLAERFEGYHSEADFWFADNDSTCKPNYFQILYYCDKPKQEPRNDTADAMSVRCVLDMLYDYHKDDPTPNPNPNPNPQPSECPSVSVAPVHFGSIEGKITPYSPNENYQIKVSGSYTGLVDNGTADYGQASGQFTDFEVSEIEQDGTFFWSFPTNDYNMLECTGVTGAVTITGPLANCETTKSFNTAQDCSLSVGTPTFTDASHVTIPVAGFYNYLSDDNNINGTFNFYNGNALIDYPDAIFDTVNTGNGNANLIASLPSTFDIPNNATSVTFNCWLNLAPEYYFCGEGDNGIGREVTAQIDNNNNNENCPTYGTVNIVNNQYKIAVGNYAPSVTTQDVFTVTCVYDIGSVGQSQIVERTGNIYYDNGYVYIGLGNDVPADYCGLTFIIKLNGACEKSLLYSYCH